MIRSRVIAWAVAAVAIVGAYGLSVAEEATQSGASGESAAPAPSSAGEDTQAKPTVPHSPIRIETVDYQEPAEAGKGPGKIKLAGTAAPGTTVYIFIDNDPYVRLVADDQGKWSVEGDLELVNDQHRLRAEQYDPETRMLAGRAMVTIGRNKVNAEP